MKDDVIRITSLETHVAGTSFRNLTLVKLTTDAGIVGWGDATLVIREHAVIAQLGYLGRIVVGMDALAPADIWRRIVDEDFFMRSDLVGRSAVSGLMVACMDIAGKAYGVPVYRLLGGPVRERIPCYANGWYKGERTPESYAELARGALALGHTAIKLDPFGTAGILASERDIREAAEIVAAIREAVGPEVEIYVDAHSRFTPAMARRVALSLEEHRIGFLEEPLAPDDYEGMRDFRASAPMPIAGGERAFSRFEFRHLIENDCLDVIQPDISWVGGLLEAQRIASWAEVHQMLISIHNANSPLATATGCHLGASIPNLLSQEMWEDFDEPWVREAFPRAPRVEDGHLPLPTGPGLGVEPDEDALAEHPFRHVFLNLSQENWDNFDAVLE